MRIAVGMVARKAHALEQLVDAVGAVLARQRAGDVDGLGDEVHDRHAGVQARVRVLEDHLQAAAVRFELSAGELGDVVPVIDDLARCGLVEPDDGQPRRGLAAPRLPHQAERLASRDVERDAVYRLDVARLRTEKAAAFLEIHLEVAHLQKRRIAPRGFGGLGSLRTHVSGFLTLRHGRYLPSAPRMPRPSGRRDGTASTWRNGPPPPRNTAPPAGRRSSWRRGSAGRTGTPWAG